MDLILTLIFSVVLSSTIGHAQSIDELEDILDAPATDRNIPPPTAVEGLNTGVSDLSTLEAFEDIAVIQKRFLPKTGRFEASFAAGLVTNDPFFNTYGLIGRMGYYFTEAYGMEFNLHLLQSADATVTEDLVDRNVDTKGFVKPTTFYGLDFKWNPIYGKMTLFNQRIVPFDIYFAAGGGITQVEYDDPSIAPSSAPTIHLATGQNFAISKSTSFRWDFSLNSLAVDTEEGTKTANILAVNVGLSFFFPEASYR